MAQHNNIAEPVRRYTRVDFTALRYKLNRLDQAAILRLYREEDLEERGVASPSELMAWLDDLRDHLVERARLVNPAVSKTLEDARLSNNWSRSVVDFIFNAAESAQSAPRPADSVSVWFKPVVSTALYADDIRTMADLKRVIEQRGSGWYRPIPRIGPGKARALERWLSGHHASLGAIAKLPEVSPAEKFELNPDSRLGLVPLERVGSVIQPLDGSQGLNRNQAFCLISARTDLDAIQAYLYRFRGRDKTLRSYQKELERFLLWCVCRRRLAMSSILMDDCERYKDFLAAPAPEWVGPKFARSSPRWRPFEGVLAPASQRYAVQVLRSFFDWLVRVRYLGGNPWVTVADPLVVGQELEMAIDKALPEQLWEQLTAAGSGLLALACAQYCRSGTRVGKRGSKDAETRGSQYRMAAAAILLMGQTGIRREEAAGATRDKLRPVPESSGRMHGMWELQVLGKRMKWRTVLMPPQVIQALREHWLDRGHNFDDPKAGLALLSPVVVPGTRHAKEKHLVPGSVTGELAGAGFSPDGLYTVVKTTLLRLAEDEAVDLSAEERHLLREVAPHALRHTFATRAAGKRVPIDVLQRLMGHISQQTTSIYVQAERARSIEEAAKFFSY